MSDTQMSMEFICIALYTYLINFNLLNLHFASVA